MIGFGARMGCQSRVLSTLSQSQRALAKMEKVQKKWLVAARTREDFLNWKMPPPKLRKPMVERMNIGQQRYVSDLHRGFETFGN